MKRDNLVQTEMKINFFKYLTFFVFKAFLQMPEVWNNNEILVEKY